MPHRSSVIAVVLLLLSSSAALAEGLIPPRSEMKTDRPRLLLRPGETDLAVTLDRLAEIPRDAEFNQVLERMRGDGDAAALAMAWRLTGDTGAADRAIERLRAMASPERPDSFAVYFRLRTAALAYDWLYGYDGFTDEVRAEVRANLEPLARYGTARGHGHIFHNYIWKSAGATALWAMAIAGEDEAANDLFDTMRVRLNDGLYPGMRYLRGEYGESPGYWTLYNVFPCALSVLAAQSAFEVDLVSKIRDEQGDWLARQFDGIMFTTLPNLRHITWGDIQGGGNGGVAHSVAWMFDAMAWATGSPAAVHWSNWLAERRGLRRLHRGFNLPFYFLYTRNLTAEPAEPPLGLLAGSIAGRGDPGGGFTVARSDWTDNATVVAFRCTNHYGDHNHRDQGSFFIYRNGHLATDPPLYRQTRGPQQATERHNTLLIDGQGQRPVRGQHFGTLAEFKQNLTEGRMLDTGELLRHFDGDIALETADGPEGRGAAASISTSVGQFAQAYPEGLVRRCVRQVTFIRPDRVVVIDWLAAPAGEELGEVAWQLILPGEPALDPAAGLIRAGNGPSHLLCWSAPAPVAPEAGPVLEDWHRAVYVYPAEEGRTERTLVHVMAVGDGPPPARPTAPVVTVSEDGRRVDVSVEPGRVFRFDGPPRTRGEEPFAVRYLEAGQDGD